MVIAPGYIQEIKEYPLVLQKAWKIKGKGVLKLDWNEGTEDIFKEVFMNYISSVKFNFNWYPPVIDEDLLHLLENYSGISKEFIQYFPGSDRALEYICRALLKEGDKVVVVHPTYDNFRIYVLSKGAKIIYYQPISIWEIRSKDYEALSELIDKEKCKIVYIVHPNNPTGWTLKKQHMQGLISTHTRTLFIIDEAYIEFYGLQNSMVSLVTKHENIVITRSFSKAWCLASLRMGYIVASPVILKILKKIINFKECTTLSLELLKIALKHKHLMENYVKEVEKSKVELTRFFSKFNNLEFRVTPANFLLLKLNSEVKSNILKYMENKRIFVRDLGHLSGFKNWIRITVGGWNTTQLLIEKLKDIFKSFSY